GLHAGELALDHVRAVVVEGVERPRRAGRGDDGGEPARGDTAGGGHAGQRSDAVPVQSGAALQGAGGRGNGADRRDALVGVQRAQGLGVGPGDVPTGGHRPGGRCRGGGDRGEGGGGGDGRGGGQGVTNDLSHVSSFSLHGVAGLSTRRDTDCVLQKALLRVGGSRTPEA